MEIEARVALTASPHSGGLIIVDDDFRTVLEVPLGVHAHKAANQHEAGPCPKARSSWSMHAFDGGRTIHFCYVVLDFGRYPPQHPPGLMSGASGLFYEGLHILQQDREACGFRLNF